MNKAVRNERLKALAGIFNNLAAASIVSGGVIPLLVANSAKNPDLGYIVTLPIGCAFALCFGAVGYMILGDLEE